MEQKDMIAELDGVAKTNGQNVKDIQALVEKLKSQQGKDPEMSMATMLELQQKMAQMSQAQEMMSRMMSALNKTIENIARNIK